MYYNKRTMKKVFYNPILSDKKIGSIVLDYNQIIIVVIIVSSEVD